MINWEAVVKASVSAAAVIIAASLGVLSYRLSMVSVELESLISESRPRVVALLKESNETARQVKIASFEIQATAKALKLEATDPESIRQRGQVIRNTNVLTGELNEAGRQFNDILMPQLTATMFSAQNLIANTDRELNGSKAAVLPSIGRAVGAADITIESLDAAIKSLATEGTITISSANALISDPDWKEFAASLSAVGKESVNTSRNLTVTSGHLAETAKSGAEIAALIKKYAAETVKWRKAIIAAQLISALTPIWTFLR